MKMIAIFVTSLLVLIGGLYWLADNAPLYSDERAQKMFP